jgi:tRNA 2-thiocytidine biosynthesis protein TtcA
MFSALQRISPSHLLDPQQFDFQGLAAGTEACPDGANAIDAEEFSSTASALSAPIDRAATIK